MTGLADFHILGDTFHDQGRKSAGNSLVAPEIAAAISLVLSRLHFLRPSVGMSEHELVALIKVREKTILEILKKSYEVLEGEHYPVKFFSTKKLPEVLDQIDGELLRRNVESAISATEGNENDKSGHYLPYDWGSSFLPFRFGAGDIITDLLERANSFTLRFPGEVFHFTQDNEMYHLERTDNGYILRHPMSPNTWFFNNLKKRLNLERIEVLGEKSTN